MASACVLVFAFTAFLQEIRLFCKPMFRKHMVSHNFSCIFQPVIFNTCFIFISNILWKVLWEVSCRYFGYNILCLSQIFKKKKPEGKIRVTFFSSKRGTITETSHENILLKNAGNLEKSSTNKNFLTLAFSLCRPIKSYRRSRWKIFLLFSFRPITPYPCISLSLSAENIIKILSGRFSSIMLIYNKTKKIKIVVSSSYK